MLGRGISLPMSLARPLFRVLRAGLCGRARTSGPKIYPSSIRSKSWTLQRPEPVSLELRTDCRVLGLREILKTYAGNARLGRS